MIRRILVALDGSPRAPGVAAAAVEIAARFGAVLIPFRAIQLPPEFPPAAHVKHADLLAPHAKQAALDELGELVGDEQGPWVTALVRCGQPWRTILDAAEEHDVDLIVLGSHGYGAIDRVLGTTASKVVNRAQRNVFVVHERGAPRAGASGAAGEPQDD